MDPERICITRHAWDRFQERWQGPRPTCWRRELHRLLRQSTPEDLGHGAVLRLMDHAYQSAQYYTVDGWRFVVDEERASLLTCERAYKKGIKKRGKPFNRRRYGK